MLSKSIPGEERLFQEPLSRCTGLGTHMLVSGQTLWCFRGIYQRLCNMLFSAAYVTISKFSVGRVSAAMNLERSGHGGANFPAVVCSTSERGSVPGRYALREGSLGEGSVLKGNAINRVGPAEAGPYGPIRIIAQISSSTGGVKTSPRSTSQPSSNLRSSARVSVSPGKISCSCSSSSAISTVG